MRLKTNIEIVTGFIDAGKTSFINSLVENTLIENEDLVIFLLEDGEIKIKEDFKNNGNIIVKNLDISYEISKKDILNILDTHNPYRIIIEFNSTKNLYDFLNIFKDKTLNKYCRITTVFHITKAETFNIYLNNMGGILLPLIELSNLVIVNNSSFVDENQLKDIEKRIDLFNPYVYIVNVPEEKKLSYIMKNLTILDNGFLKKLRVFFKKVFCL